MTKILTPQDKLNILLKDTLHLYANRWRGKNYIDQETAVLELKECFKEMGYRSPDETNAIILETQKACERPIRIRLLKDILCLPLNEEAATVLENSLKDLEPPPVPTKPKARAKYDS